MQNLIIKIDANRITDWSSFHHVFTVAFGFPEFYGRNMDAWNDCMSSLDAPEDGMTKIHISSGNVVVLQIENIQDFSIRCPEQYAAIIESSAFVNYSRIIKGLDPLLSLAFFA